ncbi:hypothetical protein [Companilactobacillus zhachilii]|uniref:hypothetical protein n=1 Tax=Companilactobacillus zhachilii TaxID=2304606 RepID=UPI00403431DD
MNKTKVMQIINSIDLGLNIIEEGQQLDTQVLTESVRTDVEDLKEELNSKPVMPKVFENWHEWEIESCSCYQDEIDDLLNIFNGLDKESGDYEILDWIKNDDRRTAIDRLLMCIDAILNGYEVEK